MIKLEKTLLAYNTAVFKDIAKEEITALDSSLLPLQQGLSLSSYVGKSPFSITLLNISDDAASIKLKAGIFYTGIIAGCSCSDDPSPVDEQNEYCDLLFTIDKSTAETTVELLEH
ncbi:MAG: hypothetical protein OQK95_05045 [Gammaproteobacteria bacterium]|nr:hypothetical protein [Gammaproteobacteria bacterium]